jgi:hypothetical protein
MSDPVESEFNKLNISDEDSNLVLNTNQKNCSYCDELELRMGRVGSGQSGDLTWNFFSGRIGSGYDQFAYLTWPDPWPVIY